MKKKIKILLADDQVLFIEGLVAILQGLPEVEQVDFVFNGKQALEQLKEKTYDLLICDINMPVMDGLALIRQVKKKTPELKVLTVSAREDVFAIAECMKSGVDGYLLKIASRQDFIEAIGSLMNGGKHFGEAVLQRITGIIGSGNPEQEVHLSKREKEIIQLICQEKSTIEMAELLFLSEHTVITHRRNIMEKTGVKNMAGLVMYAMKNGLI